MPVRLFEIQAISNSHHLKTGESGIQMVIFRTQFVSSFQMVKLAILFLTIQKLDWFSDHSTLATGHLTLGYKSTI
jgi:hypothetical protein